MLGSLYKLMLSAAETKPKPIVSVCASIVEIYLSRTKILSPNKNKWSPVQINIQYNTIQYNTMQTNY